MRTWGDYRRFKSGGGEASIEKLHYPVCSHEEISAIAELVVLCPVDFRQKALDEIEGSRQAEIIKINLVPFAFWVNRYKEQFGIPPIKSP